MSAAYVPHADLVAAINALLSTEQILALVPGGIVDALPVDPQIVLPVVRVQIHGKPVGPIAAMTQWECEAEIDIFTNGPGDQAALEIANAIMAPFEALREAKARLDAPGWDVVVASLQDLVMIPGDFINDQSLRRWTMPILLQAVKQ